MMAPRLSARNEPLDPSLPQKQRARWRFIGATVLALGAMIVLPLALESEPRRPLSDLQITIPDRAELGRRNQSWPDVAYRADGSLDAEAGGDKPGLFTRDAEATESSTGGVGNGRAMVAVDADKVADAGSETTTGPAAISSAGVTAATSAAVATAVTAAKATADSAREIVSSRDRHTEVSKAEPSHDAPHKSAEAKDAKAKVVGAAAKPAVSESKSAKGQAKPSDPHAKAATHDTKPATQVAAIDPKAAKPVAPPMPQRRTDRNQVDAASPGGFVVQLGAYSSRKGANTQLDRAKKLGFKPYAEPFSTKQGEIIRVRIGPYLTRDQADQARTKLRKSGIETTLIAP